MLNRSIAVSGKLLLPFLMLTSAIALAAGDTPAAPGSVSGNVVGSTVTLTWEEPADDDGVVGYNVYRDNQYITTVTDTQFEGAVEPGVLHAFTVVAFDSAPRNFSPSSEPIFLPEGLIPEDTTIPPSIPTSLSGEIDGTTVNLIWEASTDDESVQGYNVYQNNDYLTTVLTPEYTGTVVDGSVYSYFVVAFDGRNNFSPRSDTLFLPDAGPIDTSSAPDVPANLSAITSDGGGETSVSLTWNEANDDRGISGYNIYVDDAYRTTVFGTSYDDVIPTGSFSTYSVVAFDIDGNFSSRTEGLLVPEPSSPIDPDSPPTQPQTLLGTSEAGSDGDTISLSWQASEDNVRVLGYNVYRNNNYVDTVLSSNYSLIVPTGSINSFYVVAFDAQNNFSEPSAPVVLPETSDDRVDEPPTVPSGLAGRVDEASGTVELTWLPSSDDIEVAGYNVYRNNSYVDTVFDNRYSGSVEPGQIYSFYVVAFDVGRNFSAASERISVPDASNQAPFFVNLSDQLIEAGPVWELVIQPQDVDGGVPGLFISRLPEGMRSIDNFNGTRSLIWQPLQPDVGEYSVQITAFDAEDPSITTVETIRLTVVLPDDLSIIPNRPPTIDAIDDFVVRAGDSIVLRVKANDANGTIPSLNILNPPAGSSFNALDSDPRVRELRFESTAADLGTAVYNFMATDSDDASLTANGSGEIEFRNAADFTRQGSRLRDLAEQAGIQFGFASLLEYTSRPDGHLYGDIAAEEFNLVTPENSMKWGYINPDPGRYRFEDADQLMIYAAENGMDVHGHALVWYTQLPQWVIESETAERETLMNEFIDTMTARYSDVAIWDVVNEAFEDDGSFRNSIWFQAMGESHIDRAFIRTRAGDPDAVLIYNDYDVAQGGAKSDAMYALVSRLVSEGVPIDGVGFQMHIDTDFNEFDAVASNFQRFADLGVDIYITELDVNMQPGATEDDQALVFANTVQACLNQPACKATQIWGFTDRYSWRLPNTPLVLDRYYQTKPAYEALQGVLGGDR